jgi:hypothetical protein
LYRSRPTRTAPPRRSRTAWRRRARLVFRRRAAPRRRRRPVVASYLQQVREFPPAVQPMDERRPNYAALGHTIDYRLRLALGSGPGGAVETGVRLLGSSALLHGAPALVCGRLCIRLARSFWLVRKPTWPVGGWVRRSSLCHVAGFYEAVYRTGAFSRRRNLLALADARTTLQQLTAAVPACVVEDIAEQMQLAERPFALFLQMPEKRQCAGRCSPAAATWVEQMRTSS